MFFIDIRKQGHLTLLFLSNIYGELCIWSPVLSVYLSKFSLRTSFEPTSRHKWIEHNPVSFSVPWELLSYVKSINKFHETCRRKMFFFSFSEVTCFTKCRAFLFDFMCFLNTFTTFSSFLSWLSHFSYNFPEISCTLSSSFVIALLILNGDPFIILLCLLLTIY